MKCEFPDCNYTATTTWALVPLCQPHRNVIAEETDKYYRGSSSKPVREQRPQYYKIAHMIPWSRP